MCPMTGSFELGVVDAMTKTAQVKEVESLGGAPTKKIDKAAPKKPSRKLGLGEETMDMGETKINKAPLDQPAKPKRY